MALTAEARSRDMMPVNTDGIERTHHSATKGFYGISHLVNQYSGKSSRQPMIQESLNAIIVQNQAGSLRVGAAGALCAGKASGQPRALQDRDDTGNGDHDRHDDLQPWGHQ